MIRKLSFSAALLMALAAASCGGSSSSDKPSGPTQPGTAAPAAPTAGAMEVDIPSGAVGMGSAAYGTNPLVVKAGTTVTWVNRDGMPHTATSDSGIWDSGTLNSGQSFSFQFKDAGTFPYHCTIHGAASMSGTVQVTP